jgi:hypothetical protein
MDKHTKRKEEALSGALAERSLNKVHRRTDHMTRNLEKVT